MNANNWKINQLSKRKTPSSMDRGTEMSYSTCCRLCFSIDNHSHNHMNIFSVIGMEMKMNEIICEHFKCEVNQIFTFTRVICLNTNTNNVPFCAQLILDQRIRFVAKLCMPWMLVNNRSLSWIVSKGKSGAGEIPKSNDQNRRRHYGILARPR